MSEKKVVKRSVAIALGVICILLLVGTVGAVIYYNNVVNDKTAKYDNYVSDHSNTNSDVNALNSTYQDYMNSHSHTNSEYNTLNSTYNTLNSTYNTLNSTYNSYVSTHSHSDTEYSSLNSTYVSLNTTYNSYKDAHSHNDTEYNSLVTRIADLQAPNLVKVNLVGTDDRPFLGLGTPDLSVTGYVCNVGTNTATNSKIHVVAYQSGGVVAIDTYINLGTIYGSDWVSVSSTVYYSGSALISWTLSLEWT